MLESSAKCHPECASLAMVVYAPWVPLAYVAAGIGLVLGTILLVDARRLRQFATIDAPGGIELRQTVF